MRTDRHLHLGRRARALAEQARRRPADGVDGADAPRDEGMALVLVLVLMLVGSFLVLPMLDYSMSVTRQNRILQSKAERVEEVKGGLRAALIDPVALYRACAASGRTTAVALAVPPGLGISSSCTTTSDALQEVPSNLRYALATTQVGSELLQPAVYSSGVGQPELDGTVGSAWCTSVAATPPVPCGFPYGHNGDASTTQWLADSSTTTTGNRVWLPYLPSVVNSLRSPTPYDMPAAMGSCKVFFPGRYSDDVVLTGSTPYYFVSGVYYFEKAVRVSGDAKVVVGSGATEGCVDSDAVAVADALNVPVDAYSNGVGGTWVFGLSGRLVVDTATSGGASGASLVFNRRLVAASDPLVVVNDVSIMSVNGLWDGISTTTADLDLPAQLHVPASRVYVSASSQVEPLPKYKPSTLVSGVAAPTACAAPPTAPTAGCPIIDINFTTTAKITLEVAGYVAVPQGSVSITTTAGAEVNKRIKFGGGILAAQVAVTGTSPAWLQLGLLNPVVQKTFKITTQTSGTPQVISVALVQVNETGGYAINSWVVQGM